MRLEQSLACIVLLFPAFAQAAPAHAHGAARMDLAVDGDRLTLSMEIPLDTTVGFERPARSEKERAALDSMTKILQNAAELFVPTPAAGCRVESIKLGEPFPGGKPKTDGHADVDATYVFRCAQPMALKGVETTLFRYFSRLQRIDVQRVTPGGQGAARLTPKQTRLSW